MLKVICVVDKVGTALDRLGKGVAKYHTNIDYKVIDVHPKRPSPEQIAKFETEALDADIIDWQYYRTAELLRNTYPWLKDKKQVLTHNNPYSIKESDWNGYDMVVGNNLSIEKDLKAITKAPVKYIPLTIDTDFWLFNEKWEANDRVIMVANRIESKKGILPVAIACGELDLKLVLVGNVSDRDYMDAIMATGNVEFHENINDEELRQLYWRSTVHVCNSVDNFESGTLPILEAMLTGVPVLTRKVGHVPDLYNSKNMEILNNDPDNVLYIKERLQRLVLDKQRLSEMRSAAWDTAKTRSNERRAYMYQKLYRELMSDQRSVSVVVPIYDKPELTRQCIDGIANQSYKNIEVIVCNDNAEPEGRMENRKLIKDLSLLLPFPVRYIDQPEEGYGIAKQRNLGIIEATGEIIVFCDQRIIMENNAIEEFVKQIKPKTWLFGDKNGKTTFVENFSCVFRHHVIECGLFNERIDHYGGMSQEIRTRINRQGFEVKLVYGAKARQSNKSKNKWQQRQDIISMKNKLFKMGF